MGRALVSVWSALFLAFFGSLSLSSCCWTANRTASSDKARQEIESRVTLIRLTAFLGQVKSPKPILGLTVGRVNPVPGGHTVPTWHGNAISAGQGCRIAAFGPLRCRPAPPYTETVACDFRNSIRPALRTAFPGIEPHYHRFARSRHRAPRRGRHSRISTHLRVRPAGRADDA